MCGDEPDRPSHECGSCCQIIVPKTAHRHRDPDVILSHKSREDHLLQLLRAVARHCIHTICYVKMEDGRGTSGQAEGYVYAQNSEKGKQMLLATQYKS